MADEKLNKSGNRRGMSKGSQEVAKRNNFRNKTPEERREIATKGAEATNLIISEKKTFAEFAKEDANEFMKDRSGNSVPVRLAFIKKLRQMFFNGNLKAGELYIKLTGEDPAQKLEFTNSPIKTVFITPDEYKQTEDLIEQTFNEQ